MPLTSPLISAITFRAGDVDMEILMTKVVVEKEQVREVRKRRVRKGRR